MNLKQVTAIICPLCFVERDMFFVLRLYYAQNLHTDSHCPIVERHVQCMYFFDTPLLPFHHPSVSVSILGCVMMVMTFLFMTQV